MLSYEILKSSESGSRMAEKKVIRSRFLSMNEVLFLEICSLLFITQPSVPVLFVAGLGEMKKNLLYIKVSEDTKFLIRNSSFAFSWGKIQIKTNFRGKN